MDGDDVKRTQTTDLTRTLAEQASAVDLRRRCPSRCAHWRGNACSTITASRWPGPTTRWRPSCSTNWRRPAARRRPASSATDASFPVLSAALVNGAIGHALDYDDVNLAMPGHPSVAILPGLLALAEQRQSSGQRGHRRLCRRLRDRLPHRHGVAARPLRPRLSRHRHGRRVRRRGGLRASARPRCRGDGARARHRRHPGGRAQIAIRHDVQAVPRRQGVAERLAGGPSRGARLFQPPRSRRMRAGFRADARPRFRCAKRRSQRRRTGFTSSPISSSTMPPAT